MTYLVKSYSKISEVGDVGGEGVHGSVQFTVISRQLALVSVGGDTDRGEGYRLRVRAAAWAA